MALDKHVYAMTIADKFNIHLRGSGKKISIEIDETIVQAGKSVPWKPDVIILGQSAFRSEEELANTIAHELNHARARLKGVYPGEDSAYHAGDTLAEYIQGLR